MTDLRIVFMGTPDLAGVILAQLLQANATVLAVVTQVDKPKGRELKLSPSPVKQLAQSAGLPVLQPARARDPEFLPRLQTLNPDLIVVAAYGQILPQTILDLPRLGCINVHTSLLPKYRGAAPIQWAIINGEQETGVTIMQMDAGLDTGAILAQARCPILPTDTSQSLHDGLAQLGASLLIQTMAELAEGKIVSRPQPAEGASYAPKIKKEDGRLDWSQSAQTLWNRIRGLTPWPGTFTLFPTTPKTLILKVWQAEILDLSGPPGEILSVDKNAIIVGCGANSLKLLEMQREGGRRLKVADFLAGFPLAPGQRFA